MDITFSRLALITPDSKPFSVSLWSHLCQVYAFIIDIFDHLLIICLCRSCEPSEIQVFKLWWSLDAKIGFLGLIWRQSALGNVTRSDGLSCFACGKVTKSVTVKFSKLSSKVGAFSGNVFLMIRLVWPPAFYCTSSQDIDLCLQKYLHPMVTSSLSLLQ